MQALNQKLARLITGERNTVPIRELFRREKTSGGSGRTCIVVSKTGHRNWKENWRRL